MQTKLRFDSSIAHPGDSNRREIPAMMVRKPLTKVSLAPTLTNSEGDAELYRKRKVVNESEK